MKRVVVFNGFYFSLFRKIAFSLRIFLRKNGNSEERGSYAKFVVGLWSVTLAWSFFSGPGCAPGPLCASSTFRGCNRVGPSRSRETAGWGHSCTPWPGVPHRPGHCRLYLAFALSVQEETNVQSLVFRDSCGIGGLALILAGVTEFSFGGFTP